MTTTKKSKKPPAKNTEKPQSALRKWLNNISTGEAGALLGGIGAILGFALATSIDLLQHYQQMKIEANKHEQQIELEYAKLVISQTDPISRTTLHKYFETITQEDSKLRSFITKNDQDINEIKTKEKEIGELKNQLKTSTSKNQEGLQNKLRQLEREISDIKKNNPTVGSLLEELQDLREELDKHTVQVTREFPGTWSGGDTDGAPTTITERLPRCSDLHRQSND